MNGQSVPVRSDVPTKYKWNAESVYPTEQAWSAEVADIQATIPAVKPLDGHLADSPGSLAMGLEAVFALLQRVDKLFMYAYVASAVDTGDQQATARVGEAQSVRGQVNAAIAFLEPELLDIGRKTLLTWTEVEPRLALYAHFFEDLFRKQAHVRSAEVEELLGMLADPFAGPLTTYNKLTTSDLAFPPAIDEDGRELPLSPSTIRSIMTGADRRARQTAWQNQNDVYLSFKNTLSSNLATSIKQNVVLMRARQHKSTLEMTLFEQNIPVDVFHNLIDTFRKNLPTWHRYWAVRRKALGLDELHPYDIWAPLTDDPPAITYEQSVEWISQGLAPLGEEYAQAIRRGCLEDRWVDVYPNQGKGSGAFSTGSQGTYPFIIMSYVDNIFGLGALAHELGHSMHSYLTWRYQPPVYADYSMFVAEVASNFHEAMTRAYLLENQPDPAFQIAVIEQAMSNFHRYFLIMPTLARFELEAHRQVESGRGLTSDGLIDLMAGLFAEAFGDEMVMDHDRVGITWATFGHLFLDYYVFQYATGISGANALANRVLSGEPGAADEYLNFLKSGGSMYPLDALKVAGVDLTQPEPVEEAFSVLSGLVDRLERLVS